MKPELDLPEGSLFAAGADLASLRVECVYCDARGEPVRRRAVSLLSLLDPRRHGVPRRLFAAVGA